jgi:ribosomal protein L11 methyltransferase
LVDPGPPDDEGLSAGDTWIELSVRADLEAVEAVSEILSRFAPGGTSVQPGFELIDEGLGARIDPNEPAIVRAYLPGRDRTAARLAVRQAREALGHLQAFNLRPIGELEVAVVHEADWAHAWKAHFPVLRIGRRLVIRPTWRRHRRRPADVVLALDPGMAFGTGLHPTTRLCLAGIERWADEGLVENARVLDVGCGSGILLIAAGLFGAGELVGVDTDPIAVEASAANAARNQLKVDVRFGSLPSRRGPFDLVVANLIASLLIALVEELRAELRPDGRLLASGIFVDREADVRSAFQAAGLALLDRTAEGEWVALEFERGPEGRVG